MSILPANLDTDGQQPRPILGDGLKISFACPGCGDVGWVEWKNLSRGMHCRGCGCRFGIDRGGQLSARSGSSMRYECPRCAYAGFMPSASIVSGLECPGCSIVLVRGPDNRLHSRDEVATPAFAPPPADLRKAATRDNEPFRWGWQSTAGVAGAAALLVLALLIFALSGSSSPAALAEDYAQQCLAGDWEGAQAKLLPDKNKVQQAEFLRWKIRFFASIEAKFRPPGDKVSVEVTTLKAQPKQMLFQVAMSSRFFGSRRHLQCWRQRDEAWYFDAAASLAAQDGPSNAAVTAP